MNDRFFDSIFFDEPFLMGCSFRKEESKMENWLTIVVGVFLLGMVAAAVFLFITYGTF